MVEIVAQSDASAFAPDAYVIRKDNGGEIKQYRAKYEALNASGRPIVVDGVCDSACTMVVGEVPLERICVTPRARLGFHAAYFDPKWTNGKKITSYAGTAELMSLYPQPIKDWITTHGGLTPQTQHLTGAELRKIIKPCP